MSLKNQSQNNWIKQAMNGLVHAHVGELLPWEEKCRLLEVEPAAAEQARRTFDLDWTPPLPSTQCQGKILPMPTPRLMLSTLAFGILSIVIFALLYRYADTILEYSRQGRWYFLIPVGIAFLISYIHGQFTGKFWELLGVKAKNGH